jgi:hypothetical protein
LPLAPLAAQAALAFLANMTLLDAAYVERS